MGWVQTPGAAEADYNAIWEGFKQVTADPLKFIYMPAIDRPLSAYTCQRLIDLFLFIFMPALDRSLSDCRWWVTQ